MASFLSDKRAPVLAALLLFSFLLLLSAQVRMPDAGARVQGGLLALLSPVARAGAGSVDGVRGLWQGYIDLRGLRQENEKLLRDIGDLRLETQRLSDAARENDRLTELLSLQQSLTLQSVAARVLSLQLSGPFRVAILDRGWRHGVGRDDAVITADGVVGRVTAVTGSLAKVQLIVDPSSGAAAIVQRSRIQGMVAGRAVNELEMHYVASLADLVPGDAVDTSGLDGIYGKGFCIGQVREVAEGNGLALRVVITTSVDFRTLEEVLILVGGSGPPVFPETSGGGSR